MKKMSKYYNIGLSLREPVKDSEMDPDECRRKIYQVVRYVQRWRVFIPVVLEGGRQYALTQHTSLRLSP